MYLCQAKRNEKSRKTKWSRPYVHHRADEGVWRGGRARETAEGGPLFLTRYSGGGLDARRRVAFSLGGGAAAYVSQV